MAGAYEISEQDIEVTLRYLKYHDPENATRDKAIAMLEELKAGIHSMAHNNPDLLIELQKDLDKHKKD